MKCELMQLSAIPIFIVEWHEDIVNKNNLDFLLNLEMNKDDSQKHLLQLSKDTHILKNERLKSIQKIHTECSKQFTENVLGVTNEFKMTHSWLTKNVKGSKHHAHTHVGLMFSSVTYFNEDLSNGPFAPIKFYIPGLKNTFRDNYFKLDIKEYNEVNSSSWTIQPQKNQIIFFPAYLSHETEENVNDKTRFCIASNYFIHGHVFSEDKYHGFKISIE